MNLKFSEIIYYLMNYDSFNYTVKSGYYLRYILLYSHTKMIYKENNAINNDYFIFDRKVLLSKISEFCT